MGITLKIKSILKDKKINKVVKTLARLTMKKNKTQNLKTLNQKWKWGYYYCYRSFQNKRGSESAVDNYTLKKWVN